MKKLLFAAMVLASAVVSADQTISAERLTRIDRLFQQYVDEARIGGAVALVLQEGNPGLRARVRLERQGSGSKDDDRHDLPHRLADQGVDQRGDPVADGGREDRAQ